MIPTLQDIKAAWQGLGTTLAAMSAPVVYSLATLAPGFARALGPYADPQQPAGVMIVEDNCLVMWEAGDMAVYPEGAGHGPSQQTNTRGLDFKTLQWANLSPSTPLAEQVVANVDKLNGKFITSNQPTARHGYDLCNVIGDWLYVLAARGMPDSINDINGAGGPGTSWGGRTYKRNLRTGEIVYLRFFSLQDWGAPLPALPSGCKVTPWYFASQSEVHKPSGLILVVGIQGVNGPPAMWLYDPVIDDVIASMPIALPGFLAGAGWLAPYGDDPDVFHLFCGGAYAVTTLRVAEIRLNASDLTKSTVKVLPPVGTPPAQMWGFRTAMFWHPVAKCYIGNMSFGYVYAFRPSTREWKEIAINVEAGSAWLYPPSMGFAPHDAVFHAPTNTLLFCQYEGGQLQQTWAYRFDPASFDATPIGSTAPFAIGATRYATLMDAGYATKDGDTLLVDPGLYIGQAFDFGKTANVTVKCAVPGGRARFLGGVASSKASFAIGNAWVFDGIDGGATRGSEGNEASIRVQGDNLTFRNGHIADCNDGILTNPDTKGAGVVLIEDSVFERCGNGTGQSHNLYIGLHGDFILNRVVSNDANVGHCVKSRAARTTIHDGQIYEGRASRAIDTPEGGVLTINGSAPNASTVRQDVLTNNANIIGYAMELGKGSPPVFPTGATPTWPVNAIHIDANTTIANTKPGAVALQVLAGFPVTIDDQGKRA